MSDKEMDEPKQESNLINSGDSSEYEYYEEVDDTDKSAQSSKQQRDTIKSDALRQAQQMMKHDFELKWIMFTLFHIDISVTVSNRND